jgi:hypothetical protein
VRSARDWWQRRRARTRWLLVGALLLATAVVGVATAKATHNDPSAQIGAPIVQLQSPEDKSCRRRGRRVIALSSRHVMGADYQSQLHSFQQACTVEAQRRSLTGFPLPTCATLSQPACTLYRPPPWTQTHQATAPPLSIARAPTVDGRNVAAWTTSSVWSGSASLTYGKPIPVDRRRSYAFSAYLRGAGAGEISIEMYVLAVNARGKTLYKAVPLDQRVLRPTHGIRAPDLAGSIDVAGHWRRFGGFFPPRTWGTKVAGVKIVFDFDVPTSPNMSQVLVDAVQFEPGMRVTRFTRSPARNRVRDPSFELGGFAP